MYDAVPALPVFEPSLGVREWADQEDWSDSKQSKSRVECCAHVVDRQTRAGMLGRSGMRIPSVFRGTHHKVAEHP